MSKEKVYTKDNIIGVRFLCRNDNTVFIIGKTSDKNIVTVSWLEGTKTRATTYMVNDVVFRLNMTDWTEIFKTS